MRKKAWKLRELNIRRSRDAMRKLSREKKNKSRGPRPREHARDELPVNVALNSYTLIAPEELNLDTGITETLRFFEQIKSAIRKSDRGQNIFFDLSKAKNASAAAIMCIIALIKNVRKAREKGLSFSGNLPINQEARLMFEKTGFLRFVRSYRKNFLFSNRQNVQIMSGYKVTPEPNTQVCDFVQNACNTGRKSTKGLYRMLLELMTNTTQHAYTNYGGEMHSAWYLYAEDEGDTIKFVFLDTGEGIPSTVNRTVAEKFRQFVKSGDEHLLKTALEGAFRTSTGESYRGRGLPDICRDIKATPGAFMQLISGRGMCRVSYSNEVTAKGLDANFGGTLFVWRYEKDRIKEVV